MTPKASQTGVFFHAKEIEIERYRREKTNPTEIAKFLASRPISATVVRHRLGEE
jgi:hypothetical protein